MNLTTGQQIQNQGQSLYEVGELVSQTGGCSMYSGFRRFLNYKYQERQFYYAADDERAKVLVKIPDISNDVSENEMKQIRSDFQYECKEVLSRHARWFPQIIDSFEIPENQSIESAQSVGSDSQQTIPVLVVDNSFSGNLAELVMTDQLSAVDRVQISVTLLNFFESIQNQKQYCSGVSLEELRVGTHLRLQSIFSHRIADIVKPASVKSIPDNVYFAPEFKKNPVKVTEATDIYHWAVLAALIVGGKNSAQEINAADDYVVLPKSLLKEVQQTFVKVSESNELILRPLSPEHYQKKAKLMVKGLGALISSCLHHNLKKRPVSFSELRKKAAQASSGGIKNLLNPFA